LSIDDDIRRKLEARSQYKRMSGLERWEETATKAEREKFYRYVRNWLELKREGHSIGWAAFATLCQEDLKDFEVGAQALKGALSARIKRL